MTSYKLYLTFLALVSVTVTASSLFDRLDHQQQQQQRARRASNGDKEAAEESSPDDSGGEDGSRVGYRFGEEFFLPEASKAVPAKYKKKADGCERVVKDTMVCMVCKDPKTFAKYEQCSYVGNPPAETPRARSPAWKKQVSYDPNSSSEYAESPTNPHGSYDNYAASAPSRGSSNNGASTPSRGASSYHPSKPHSPPTYGSSTPSRGSSETYDSTAPSHGDYESYEASKPEASLYNYNDNDDSPSPYSYSGSSKEDSESAEDPAESSDCRQIEKDSQTCKVCKDPKTGRDFERCSSSYQPDDKTYAYGKSEAYGYPGSEEDDDKGDYKTFENDSESAEDPAESSDCRQVKKDDQTCTICRDPKTGQDSEQCSSSHRPADKAYAYGTSETYGGPSSSQDEESHDDEKTPDATYANPGDYRPGYLQTNKNGFNKYRSELPKKYRQPSYDSGYESPNHGTGSGGAEYAAPSAPVASAKTGENRDADGCYRVQKDSMNCKVCADPKTGGNSEQCSYAYQPDDKVYKFTKSKSFGYPENGEGTKYSGARGRGNRGSADSLRQSESKQVVETVKNTPCKRIQKGSMLCTICKDPKSGGNSEQCTYGSKPSEKGFTYSSSKSAGNPRNEKDSNEELDGQQESRQVPQWSGEDTSRQLPSESKPDVDHSNACRHVRKGSMTCAICKDRKTGAKTQRCAYSSQPKDDRYTYSKSKLSGSPKKPKDARGKTNESLSPENAETKQVETTATSPCKKIEKDSMTCTVCKDPVTGENSEQCSYSYKPKPRYFGYNKSNSSGKPQTETEQAVGETPHESRRISRTSNDGQDIKSNKSPTKTNWSRSR